MSCRKSRPRVMNLNTAWQTQVVTSTNKSVLSEKRQPCWPVTIQFVLNCRLWRRQPLDYRCPWKLSVLYHSCLTNRDNSVELFCKKYPYSNFIEGHKTCAHEVWAHGFDKVRLHGGNILHMQTEDLTWRRLRDPTGESMMNISVALYWFRNC